MKLHTPSEKADWQLIKSTDWNIWQKLADKSGGLLTPGNFISIAGIALVIIGLINISFSNFVSGSIIIAIGRAFDVLDGYIADLTKTKSPIGEAIDTTIDKLAVLMALIAITLSAVLPNLVIVIMFVISLWISSVALLARHRQVNIHPGKIGKIATASIWISIILFLLSNEETQIHGLINFFAYVFFAIFISLGFITAYRYSKKILYSATKIDSLTSQFENFIIILNPKSSNIKRTRKRIDELKNILPSKPLVIKTGRSSEIIKKSLEKSLKKNSGKTLLFIGGGDGTVHQVINSIMTGRNKHKVVVLPIWGGNANDLAFMLNGLSYQEKLSKVLASGKIVDIYPLKITLNNKKNKQQIYYSICYASFGATAFAANQLDQQSSNKNNILQFTTLGVAIQEIKGVTDAFRKSPVFRAKINGEKVTIFEEAFMNGPRMAKLNSFPVKLNKKVYYRAHQPNKHPLLSRRVVQAVTGQKFGEITSRPTSFTVRESILAQFDGEVSKIPKNSKITISLSAEPIKAVSIKLNP